MAISLESGIKALLKTWYKDGVENLLFRNSPLLKMIEKVRVEGKEQAFSAIYSSGGAVGANFVEAKKSAATTAKAEEFKTYPGQLFSVYQINAKEATIAVSNKGAYMPIQGAKMFAATESLRKVLATCLYSDGTGFIGNTTKAGTSLSGVGTIYLPNHSIMGIDIGTQLVIGTDAAVFTVTSIDGSKNEVKGTYTGVASKLGDKVSYAYAGSDLLPKGLASWLPKTSPDSSDSFFGVNRSIAPDRLAGARYTAGSGESKISSIEALITIVRRQGSNADLIVLNDEDWKAVGSELATTNTFFTKTSGKNEEKNATIGFNNLSAGMSTSFIDNIIDDPYCPKGTFYVLDKEAVKFWGFTNADKLDDGLGNQAGKESADVYSGADYSKNYSLVIDDFVSVQPGAEGINGPSVDVTLMLYGGIVVINPSNCGVGTFA